MTSPRDAGLEGQTALIRESAELSREGGLHPGSSMN